MKQRKIRTSIGLLGFECRHLRCVNCRKTQAPLANFLKLERYQTKTVELEQIVSEIITDQSYRRMSQHLKIIGSIEIPKSTAHDWIKATPCDVMAQQLEFDFAQILPDGTGYKKRPAKPGGSNRGELKVMIGVDVEGDAYPMGVWSDKSWAEIGTAILDPEEAEKRDRPLADDLVVDGEPGMVEGLEHLADGVQRCHWHLSRDLGHSMWQDDAPLGERKIKAKKLSQLIAIELPKGSVDEISEEEKAKLLERCNQVERELDQFIDDLDAKGYEVAANYVSNAKRHLFTYLGTWLELGIRCPRTTSLIERLMREIGRRLKKIAFGWRESGAAKMARMVIARILNPTGWRNHWEDRKQIAGNAIIVLQGIQVVS
jgi:transposase-like protein